MKKKCSACKKYKIFSEFNRHATKSDGLQSYCKTCQIEYWKQYAIQNIKKEQIRCKKYQDRHWNDAYKKHKNMYIDKTNKRRRNFGFNILFPNYIKETIVWHHINNDDVVAIPKDLHIYFGKYHRENMMHIIKQIYPIGYMN